jgi:hypothetical protein
MPPRPPDLLLLSNAAAILFAKILNTVPGIHPIANQNGWPRDPELVRKAHAIWIFCAGSNNHLVAQDDHATQIQAAAQRGSGIMFYHFGTEPPEAALHKEFLDWTEGYFELNYSVNRVFEADFKALPKHSITRGVMPFSIKDEWYYNIRFREKMKDIT